MTFMRPFRQETPMRIPIFAALFALFLTASSTQADTLRPPESGEDNPYKDLYR